MRPQASLQFEKLLKPGKVYRREMLLPYSTAIDRTLHQQSEKGSLEKVGPGLYYCPKKSRFGTLAPNPRILVQAFLKGDTFLLFSRNEYNALGLGLTQLYNQNIVYNHKRHEVLKLAGQSFDFRRPNRGFPATLSKEFLLVDLMNNLDELAEDSELIQKNIHKQWNQFDRVRLLQLAGQYGKIKTRKFLKELNQ